ncbi:MAG: hypothetical protein HY885_18610 [Deltaproteobacteria bacterium]|nr:hypothetical protein [Deltaproteobacteria bacterium]
MALLRNIMIFFVFFLQALPGYGLAGQFVGEGRTPSYLEPSARTLDGAAGKKSEADELRIKVQSLAEELLANLGEPDPQLGDLADGVVVCILVDINNLYRTSSFGRYVAEQLLNEFQRYGYPVLDMRKSLSVMVQEKRGEFGLSRDPAEILSSQASGAMLTGTYLVGEKEIIVNARILDNKRGGLLSSATMVFPLNNLGIMMLKDTATARNKPAGVIYMKRLEM